MGDKNREWHIYSASNEGKGFDSDYDRTGGVTVEMCMTGMERAKPEVFVKRSGDYSAREMTELSGISDIMPGHVICDSDFDPCGYSMNGIEGACYSTALVTPEAGFSYASYEARVFDTPRVGLDVLTGRVARCFGPCKFSIAATCGGGSFSRASESGEVDGYRCQNVVKQGLPGGTWILYKTYERTPRGCPVTGYPAPAAAKQCRETAEEEEDAVCVGERLHFIGEGQLQLAQ